MTTARAAATFDRMLVGRQSGATQPSSTQPSDDRFVHEAMFYRTASELLAGTVGFVEQGLAAGEPVLVVAPAPTLSRLTDALPFSIDRVTLLDMSEAGRNPGRIIPMVLLAFADAHPGQRVRIIAEPIWPGRTGLEYPACLQHEALINTAFASRSATIRCPYDAASLSPSQLDDAARTHPWVGVGGQFAHSARYDPNATMSAANQPLPDPPAHIDWYEFDLGTLSQTRRRIAKQAQDLGLGPTRAADLTIAVNELCSNSILHGGGRGAVAIWADVDRDGRARCQNGSDVTVICQVRDSGFIADPLAGRIPVAAESTAGRGLIVTNALCHLVRWHTRPGQTTIQVHVTGCATCDML